MVEVLEESIVEAPFEIQFKIKSASARLILSEKDGVKAGMLISVFSKNRGEGDATALMERICEYADEHNYEMILNARRFYYSDGLSPDNKALAKWYKRFGFRTYKHNKSYNWMRRVVKEKTDGSSMDGD